MRIVLDTNVLVSGLAWPGGPPGRLVTAWRAGAFDLATSDFMLDELARILPALSARTGYAPSDVRDFVDILRALSIVVELPPQVLARARDSGLRDPDEVPVLATLIASGADSLVTGVRDLLEWSAHSPILSPSDFCALHSP